MVSGKPAKDITEFIRKRCAELAKEAEVAEQEWVAKNGPRVEEPVNPKTLTPEEFRNRITEIFNGELPTEEEVAESLKQYYARR